MNDFKEKHSVVWKTMDTVSAIIMRKTINNKIHKKNKAIKTYETYYKHKLNMLEPGTVMLKWIGMFLLTGLVLWLLRLKLASYIVFGLAGVIFLLLLILLVIEAHQDGVLNEIAARENRE